MRIEDLDTPSINKAMKKPKRIQLKIKCLGCGNIENINLPEGVITYNSTCICGKVTVIKPHCIVELKTIY